MVAFPSDRVTHSTVDLTNACSSTPSSENFALYAVENGAESETMIALEPFSSPETPTILGPLVTFAFKLKSFEISVEFGLEVANGVTKVWF